MTKRGRPPKPINERFWSKVQIGNPGECWLWTGIPDIHGYGQFRVGDETPGAHRVAYELTFGPLKGMACHKCDVKLCCNPNHIYDGTAETNGEDKKGVKFRSQRRLTTQERETIHARLSQGESSHSLAEEFGVTHVAILRYRHSPYPAKCVGKQLTLWENDFN